MVNECILAIPNILGIDKHYKDMTFVSNVFADFRAESCNFSKNSKINLSNQGVRLCVCFCWGRRGGGGEGGEAVQRIASALIIIY